MRSRFASEEDWVWYENLPDQLQERIIRLFDINEAFKGSYKRGYQRGYKAAMRKLKKLVVAHEHGENYG